ncbi:hypothetical protein AB1L88_27000, partial [Tautonia sp. JC769]|uniref:hypothetical protein n=1 Tax=Tautonia sp. JC769 TaxID=3232135 RepID=UPI003458F315
TYWEDLGEVTVSSGELQVRLSNQANGLVVADAIRLERVPDPSSPNGLVLDDTQQDYDESGTWQFSDLGGFKGTSRYAPAGDGSR